MNEYGHRQNLGAIEPKIAEQYRGSTSYPEPGQAPLMPTLSTIVQMYGELFQLTEDILKRTTIANERLYGPDPSDRIDRTTGANPVNDSPISQLIHVAGMIQSNLSRISAEVTKFNNII